MGAVSDPCDHLSIIAEHTLADHESYPDCIICSSPTAYYFSKIYPAYPGSPFNGALTVDYSKCGHCGFVLSETHAGMQRELWSSLNTSWHHNTEDPDKPNLTNQPPYANQALALAILDKSGIVDLGDAVDYAAGYATMVQLMRKYFGKSIHAFDCYVRNPDPAIRYVEEGELGKYRLVINSAMFEHVLNRAALDEVHALVADDGVLMLHTVICERVPPDPDWFYLKPIVHTAFHTNKSMAILMEQWGYAASIYCPQAKSWFLFKRGHPLVGRLDARVEAINLEIQAEYLIFKPGFVDYWKGF